MQSSVLPHIPGFKRRVGGDPCASPAKDLGKFERDRFKEKSHFKIFFTRGKGG